MSSPNAAAAMDAVKRSPHPSLVWIFADREGHIGMQASGWLPQRGGGNSGIVPIAAWDPQNHWQGRVRADLLPREYDPPCGFVASANEELYRKRWPAAPRPRSARLSQAADREPAHRAALTRRSRTCRRCSTTC